MKIALTGYTKSGRSTIFQALCDSFTETTVEKGRLKVKLGSSRIVDPRLDKIVQLYKSEKKTYCEIQFSDFEYQQDDPSQKGFDEQMIAQLKMTDALIYVTRGFMNENIYYRFDRIDPFRDAQELESDMLITDLSSTENRFKKIEYDYRKGKKELKQEYDLILKIKKLLDEEKPLRLQSFTDDEEKMIRGFGFLTQKKGIILINSEDDGSFPGNMDNIKRWADERGLDILVMKGKLQSELRELDESDRMEFLKEMGVEESALDKFIKAIFQTLGLVNFFTANENEARCWLMKSGLSAYDAAGVVHTDFQQKFIRAEVVRFADLIRLGSEKACKEAGIFKSEKREYIVRDGDVIFFRHN
jgi:GTP-binding protein YchF